MISLNNFYNIHPLAGLCLWKKDMEHHFIDVNKEFINHFGFKNESDLIGKTDYDLPLLSKKTIDHFHTADKLAANSIIAQRFIEIYQLKNNHWKFLLTVKSALLAESKLIGTAGYCLELSASIFQFFSSHGCNNTPQSGSYAMTVFDENLSSRENQCLFFIIRGKTAKEIGGILGISYRTVEEYIQSIKNKLNCKSKRELIAYGIEKGYLNIFPEALLNHSLFVAL